MQSTRPCTPGFGYPTDPPRCIDIDRGVSIREHKGTDSKVFMFKEKPGVYLNAHGDEVSETVAREAGFPVEQFRRERLRAEKLADAAALVEAEMASPTAPEASVVNERGGFKMLDMGFGRYLIETTEGDRVTPKAVGLAVAASLFAKLAPAPVTSGTEADAAPPA